MIDFKEITHQLQYSAIDRFRSAAFAAACAERLAPQFRKFCGTDSSGLYKVEILTGALDYVWQCIGAQNLDINVAERHLHECERQIPDEERAHASNYPYAEDAVAVVMYCLRGLVSGEIQNVLWAARRLYEVTDSFVIRTFNIDPGTREGEVAILGHRIVQDELARQLRDLKDVKRDADPIEMVAKVLRTRAKFEAEILFAI